MGAVVGLLFGLGVLLVGQALWPAAPVVRRAPRRAVRERLAELLTQADLAGVSPAGLVAAAAGLSGAGFVLTWATSRAWTIAACFAAIAAYAPFGLVRHRARQRRAQLRAVWPEVVDNLASAVRAGLALPEAVAQLASRGPEPLRGAFARFAEDYRATGRFGECLDRLKARLADPVADRLVESLRVAREVGGSDLGRLLRTLSGFLREDARTRAELETRQGWTVNAARLAVAAPWVVLGLLATRPAAVAAYRSTAGLLVLLTGGAVSLAAYRLMLRLGRLPEEERVLR